MPIEERIKLFGCLFSLKNTNQLRFMIGTESRKHVGIWELDTQSYVMENFPHKIINKVPFDIIIHKGKLQYWNDRRFKGSIKNISN